MQSDTYHRLQEIFSRFNESVITFYADLMELLPPGEKSVVLAGLRNTLDISNLLFKQVAELIYRS